MDRSVIKDLYQEGRSQTGRPVETDAKPAQSRGLERCDNTTPDTPSASGAPDALEQTESDPFHPVVEVEKFRSHQMTAVKINAAILLGVVFYYFLKFTFRF